MLTNRSFVAVVGALIAILVAPAPPAWAAPKPPDPRYDVVDSWSDATGATVYLRRGSWNGKTGWGYEKVTRYHNLNVAAVRLTTRYPESRSLVAGTKYNYVTPVHHVRCSGWWLFRRCEIVETVDVTVGVDFRNVGSGSFGVVTAFCSGDPKCPDWVRNAANNR
ncbi:hypothetical protein [Cryptosporangium arvum]|uniref:hypothetical protein n=1 Tax=Cryptosporangium arvum TaxID=80871 RepID=UPI0012ED9054|nr:hypothetical protein [Cryptosporangium arvum]